MQSIMQLFKSRKRGFVGGQKRMGAGSAGIQTRRFNNPSSLQGVCEQGATFRGREEWRKAGSPLAIPAFKLSSFYGAGKVSIKRRMRRGTKLSHHGVLMTTV